MNSKRKTAQTAHELAATFANNKFNETVVSHMRNGYDYESAIAETRRELADPDTVEALERDFRGEHPHAAEVVEEATARNAEGGRILRPVAERLGLNTGDRQHAEKIATDPLQYRVLDAVADGDWDEAERGMRHVASRVNPNAFIEKANDAEIEDAIRHGGVPTPEEQAMERYSRMTPEQLDAEMEKEFGGSGAKQVAPGVTFTTLQK